MLHDNALVETYSYIGYLYPYTEGVCPSNSLHYMYIYIMVHKAKGELSQGLLHFVRGVALGQFCYTFFLGHPV